MGEHETTGHLPSTSHDLGSQCHFLEASLEGEKKRNTNQASTSRAPPKEPVPQEENIVVDDDFWDNLHIEGDKTRGEKLTPQEEATLKV